MISRERYAYGEAGRAIAARVLEDISFESKDPAARSRAFEIDAVMHLVGPFAQLRYAPTIDAARAWKEEWATDEYRAKGRVGSAVLTLLRPGESLPDPKDGAVMLDPGDELRDVLETFERVQNEAKALVAKYWPAISSVAATMLERGEISAEEITELLRSMPTGPTH